MLDRKFKLKIIYAVVTLSFGMLSGFFTTADDYIWYHNLIQPKFNPPNWLFAPVWTILYVLIGISFYTIRKTGNHKNAKIVFYLLILHFIGNLIWSYIFFKKHDIALALYDLIFMWISLLSIFLIGSKIKNLIKLLLPYLLWLSYALYLNAKIFQLN